MTLSEQFRTEVEGFLADTGMDPTVFGREALNDPSFVFDLRQGRSCRTTTIDRVQAFMSERRAEAA